EKKIMDIGVVDTFFYKSKKFEKPNGTSRIEIVQTNKDPQDKQHHGTMVTHMIVKHNTDSKIFARSAGLSGNRNSLLIGSTENDYRNLHNKGARIFNNSYGLNGTDYGQVNATFPNVAHYAATDSIFIWAAGNEHTNHASPESLYPHLNNDARNGWITVMAVDETGNTSKLASYSNKIGDKGKNWGITARGNWAIELPASECKSGQACIIYGTGTSFSAPVVTAAVANVWTKFPWMDNHLVTMTILSSADKPGHKGEQTESPDATFGWGILNQDRALGGPGRLDKRLLTNKDEKAVLGLFTVDFDYRNYKDTRKLTWNNDMAGDGGIYKKGTGTLYLGGENTYTAITWIKEGTIGVEKSLLNSRITIEKGGTLLAQNDNSRVDIGNGNSYTITNNGGSLNVYGQGLKINGDYISKNQGRIAIDIDKSNLEITGTMDMKDSSYILADVENIYSVIGAQTKTKNIIKAKEIKNYNGDYKISNNVSRYVNLSNFYVDKNRQNIWVEYNRKATVHVLQAAGYVTASSLNTAKNFDTALDELAQTQEQNEISATAVRVMNAHANALPQMI
ncbi:S8 family serine peptidase, partial [Campylobacter pinnipediorum]